MRLSIAFIGVLVAGIFLSLAACSRPPGGTVQRQTKSGPQDETPRPTTKELKDAWNDGRRPVPAGLLGDAQQFLFAVPAFQVATTWEDLQNHRKAQSETHVVRGVALLWESNGGLAGRNGIITDGKREFVYFKGKYGEEPGDADATLDERLRYSTLRWLLDRTKEIAPLVGRDTLDGTAAVVCSFTSRQDLSPPMRVDVWLAASDHRPLKVEVKEYLPNDVRPNAPATQVETRTYHYDPNVKVTLPK